MSVSSVKTAVTRAIADKTLDKADAQAILTSAGSTVSKDEEKAIKDSFAAAPGVTVAADAKALLQGTLKDIAALRAQAARQNEMVKARAPQLEAQETGRMKLGVATSTLGGTTIPDSVKELINKAKAAGAVAYDVAQLDDPAKDDHGEGYTVTGKFSPYPQQIAPTGNMAFSYTEITPKKLAEDMSTVQTFNQIKGFKTETQVDRRTGESRSFEVAQYEKVTAKGTGSISSNYDEAAHPDTFARGPQGQKWANNYAILADGSLHALPAARRTQDQPGLILTNPSLGRGQRMLANGHIEVQNGVVTSIGISGRLQKLALDGDAKFVDPVAILAAWGFKMSPNLRVNFEGSGGAPKMDPTTHVIGG